MSLASTADAVGSDIASTLNALAKGEDQSVAAWQAVCQKLAAWIAANATATLPAMSIDTTGSASAQSGPSADAALAIS